MAKHEYICLSCGNCYRLKGSSPRRQEGPACPRCKSTNVLNIDPASLLGPPGGG